MQVQRYGIAGIDVHKKMLAVVVTDAAVEGERFERQKFGTGDSEFTGPDAMAEAARGPGSGDGVPGAVLEAGVATRGTLV